MFAFILGTDISGTVLEARIQQVCSTDHTTKAKYRLKSVSNDMSRNRNLYTEPHIEYLKATMPKMIYFFGYANVDPESQTNFFEFETHTDENRKLYKEFKAHNNNV
jgi:hypothetical protein